MSLDHTFAGNLALKSLIVRSLPVLMDGAPLPGVAQFSEGEPIEGCGSALRIALPANRAERARFVADWIARNARKLAAGLGGSVLLVPMMAQAAPVDVSTLSQVSRAVVNAEGSATLTLSNGQGPITIGSLSFEDVYAATSTL